MDIISISRLDVHDSSAYHAYPALSQSALSLCYRHTQLYAKQHIYRDTPVTTPTSAMRFGSYVDHYLCHGCLPHNVVLLPSDVLSSTGARAGRAYSRFVSAYPDGTVFLKEDEYDALVTAMWAIVENINQHDIARHMLTGVWHPRYVADLADGLQFKAELDVLDVEKRMIVDVKTSSDTSAEAFARSVHAYDYDLQAYVYRQMTASMHGTDCCFLWLVIRNTPPYEIETYSASDALLSVGEAKFDTFLAHYRRCATRGAWVSPTHGQLMRIDPPKYSHWLKEMSYVD